MNTKEELKNNESVKKDVDKYSLAEVSTQTEIVFKDNETGELSNQNLMILNIANDVNKILKLIG